MTVRMANSALLRGYGFKPAWCDQFKEEGRGLGFSIGGWHPLRINTYLPTLKKLDPLANTAVGKAFWKPIEKVDRFQAQKFQKVKKWSQDHRKQLQIAAAIAAMAVGGAFALGYLGTGAAAGAAGAGGAAAAEGAAAAAAAEGVAAGATTAGAVGAAEGASVVATTTMATETLAPLAVGSGSAGAASASLTSLVPATVTATQATTASSILGTLGKVASTAGEYGKTALTTMALVKAVSPGGQAQGGEAVMPPITVSQYGGGGYTGGGGGGFLGPAMSPVDAYGNPVAPAPETLPAWVLPAAGIGLLALLLKD